MKILTSGFFRLSGTGTILVAMVGLFLTSCNDPKLAHEQEADEAKREIAMADSYPSPSIEAVPTPASPQIPAEITIRNLSGKALEGTLLAKKGNEIAFRRTQDQQLFLISLDTLDESSQASIGRIPDAEVDKLMAMKEPTTVASTSSQPRKAKLGAEFSTDLEAGREKSVESGYPLMVILVADNPDADSASVASMIGVNGARTTTHGGTSSNSGDT